MHVGHLRHVCSCSLGASRRPRAILQTKSHQSGLGLSNETVLLQRCLPDMNDEQPSVSLARFVSHVINEVSHRIPNLQWKSSLCRLWCSYRRESLRRRASCSAAVRVLLLRVSTNRVPALSRLPRGREKATRNVQLTGKQTIKASEREFLWIRTSKRAQCSCSDNSYGTGRVCFLLKLQWLPPASPQSSSPCH